jgi:hypothetical protein
MSHEPSEALSRFIWICKWGGCCTALAFAVGGLLCDVPWFGEVCQATGAGTWVVVAIAMALGLTGVIFDRSHRVQKSSESTTSTVNR